MKIGLVIFFILISCFVILAVLYFVKTCKNRELFHPTDTDLDNFLKIAKENGVSDDELKEVKNMGENILESVENFQHGNDSALLNFTELEMAPYIVLVDKWYDTDTSLFVISVINFLYHLYMQGVRTNIDEAKRLINEKLNQVHSEGRFVVIDLFITQCEYLHMSSTAISGVIFEYYAREDLPPIVFVIYRGTKEKCEWYQDAKFSLKHPTWLENYPDAKVHTGFNNIYSKYKPHLDSPNNRSIREVLNDYLENVYIQGKQIGGIVIGGHSLGAALAVLSMGDIAANRPYLREIIRVFVPGCPYTGNREFSNIITRQQPVTYTGLFTITNKPDFISYIKVFREYYKSNIQNFCFNVPLYSNSNPHSIVTYWTKVKENRNLYDMMGKISATVGEC